MAINLISFLGVSNYLPVQYSYGDVLSDFTPYIQVALAQFNFAELSKPGASVSILMTEQAKIKHWDIEGGLAQALRGILPTASIEEVIIPELKNEEQLWKIFDKMFEIIPKNAEVILDITHGYRSMPLLGAVILDYARSLKHIKVQGIHYAAVEAKQGDIVPIVDLSKLDRLFRWNRAVELFIRGGDASGLEDLMGETARDADKEAKLGQSLPAERRLCSNLRQAYELLTTARGEEICYGEPFLVATRTLDELTVAGGFASPMRPLYNLIRSRVSPFRKDSLANLLYAISMCINYRLTQQGITLLQESIITILLFIHNLDAAGRNQREAVSKYFRYLFRNNDSIINPREEEEFFDIIEALELDPLCESLGVAFNALRDLRNNINHAGFTLAQPRPDRFEKALKEQFIATLTALAEHSEFKEACGLLLEKHKKT